MDKKNVLYIVATPIGHPDDITLRAIKILNQVDAVICEELRQGAKTLKALGIAAKDLVSLNEHNEKEQTADILQRLYAQQTLALICDGGTPIFSDPGYYLIEQVTLSGYEVIPVPGASSLTAALSILDFKMEKFIFAGFLPQETDRRKQELQRIKSYHLPVVLMDTPYRLGKLLDELEGVFGGGQRITLACDLTLPSESIFRGGISSLRRQVGKRKAEFILILHSPSGAYKRPG
jgi:16S rRNA (cytidine1402-2'-O)-methyltransferase